MLNRYNPRLRQKHGTWDACVESGKIESMTLGKRRKMGIGRACVRNTPIQPVRCPDIVREDLMSLAEGFQHALEDLRSLLH